MNAMLKAYSDTDYESMVDQASPHGLILLLFDGAIQAIAKASFAIKTNDVAAKCKAITHAYSIIQSGLQLSLDMKVGGELATNLNDLYDYILDRLLVANIKNEVEALEESSRLLGELRGAWASIDDKKNEIVKRMAKDLEPPQRTASVSYGAA